MFSIASANNLPNIPIEPMAIAIMPAKGPRPTTTTKSKMITSVGTARSVASNPLENSRTTRQEVTLLAANKARPKDIKAPNTVPTKAIDNVSNTAHQMSILINICQLGGIISSNNLKKCGNPSQRCCGLIPKSTILQTKIKLKTIPTPRYF